MNPSQKYPALADLGLLILRLALGVVFFAHGLQKFTGSGPTGPAGQFTEWGVPLPEVAAIYTTWVEMIAGAALVLGVLTPIAGLLLVIEMAGAFIFVHVPNGVFVENNGFELVLVLGAGSLLLLLTGGGRVAVDALFSRGSRKAPATSQGGGKNASGDAPAG